MGKKIEAQEGPANEHLPDFCRRPGSLMLGSGLGHVGIAVDGEVVATVWNHHDRESAQRYAEIIMRALNDL